MIHSVIILFWVLVYKILSFLIPKDKNSIVFGSWKGELFADNSRYLAEYIGRNHPEYKLYWVGKKSIETDVSKSDFDIQYLEMGRFSTNIKILRCGYCFVSQKYHLDISKYRLSDRAVICYLHHGTPIKKWGDDGLNKERALTLANKTYDRLTSRIVDYNYYASSSQLNSEVLCTAMKSCNCSKDKIISSGTPRNDMLVNYHPDKAIEYKKSYFDKLGISGKPVVIMYLPTYRRLGNSEFTFSELNVAQSEQVNKLLNDHNAVIIEKSHFAGKELVNREKVSMKERLSDNKVASRIFFADKGVNVQEMLMFTDVLISDYSGAFLDFSLLDRPIVHYVYDYEYYRDQDSGLYYDISDFHAGAITENFDQLCKALEVILDGEDSFGERRRYVRNKYMQYEQGKASQTLFETIIAKSKESI